MKGKITKISSNENAFRTKDMEGVFTKIPTVGESFRMIGEPLEDDESDVRIFTTSTVKELETKPGVDGVFIHTLNSVYHLVVTDARSS